MLNLVDFEMHHLERFKPREEMPELESMMIFNLANPIFRTVASLVDRGEVLAIVGYHLIAPGTCEVFLIPAEGMHRKAKSVVSVLKWFTDHLLEEDRFQRLQMAVEAENRKWARTLGFQEEAYLRKYHNGKDQFLYGKVSHGC